MNSNRKNRDRDLLDAKKKGPGAICGTASPDPGNWLFGEHEKERLNVEKAVMWPSRLKGWEKNADFLS